MKRHGRGGGSARAQGRRAGGPPRLAPAGLVPTGRLAHVLLIAAAVALAAGAVLPPGPGRGTAVAAVLTALAAAAADARRAPRAKDIEFSRTLRGPLRLGRTAAVTVAFRWSPGSPGGARALWWADGAPAALVARAPEGNTGLRPGQTFAATYALLPQARGTARWSGPRLALASPWGLWRTRVAGGATLERTVYPGATATVRLPGRALAAGAPSAGDAGLELDGVRPYLPGEDARRMHWRATARRDQPVMRRLRPERDRRLMLVVDAGRWSAQALGAAPGSPTRLDAFCAAALRVAATALAAGDAVGLALLSSAGAPPVLAPRGGRGALHRLGEALAQAVPAAGDADIGPTVAALLRVPSDGLLWFGEAPSPEEAGGLLHYLPRLCRHRPVTLLEVGPADPPAESGGRGDALRVAVREATDARRAALTALARRGVRGHDARPGELGAYAVAAYLRLQRGGATG